MKPCSSRHSTFEGVCSTTTLVFDMSDMKQIGVVTRYFGKIGVAAIKLSESVKVGSRILIKGNSTHFEQRIDSMQVDRKNIAQAGPKQEIAIKVDERVRENDKVFLLSG
jgi:putative protease